MSFQSTTKAPEWNFETLAAHIPTSNSVLEYCQRRAVIALLRATESKLTVRQKKIVDLMLSGEVDSKNELPEALGVSRGVMNQDLLGNPRRKMPGLKGKFIKAAKEDKFCRFWMRMILAARCREDETESEYV